MSDRETSSPISISPDFTNSQSAASWQRDGLLTKTPTAVTPSDFLLNTVDEDVRVSSGKADNSCSCGPDCDKQCCRGQRHRGIRGSRVNPPGLPNETVKLLSPVQGAALSHSPPSPSSSYGSTDEKEPLLPNQRDDLVCHSPTGGPTFVVRTGSSSSEGSSSMEQSMRCECHTKEEEITSKKARNKLILASLIALAFMIGELIGGYISNSLAILTDAAHMLSDFASFLISLFAIWVATRPPSKKFNFGWHRAEVVGAVISVLVIWVLTGVLVYEAVKRVINRDYDIDPNIMLITACVGVFVNVFMCMVLHQHGHGHGGHGHSHGGHQKKKKKESEAALEDSENVMPGEEGVVERRRRRRAKKEDRNINVRAAFIHVIGDLIQSVGVVIAGYVIWFGKHYAETEEQIKRFQLADPICTFFFSILVLFSTLTVLRDALRVLMEGTPRHIDHEEVRNELDEIPGVKCAHSLHIWSLTLNKIALAAHLAVEPGANNQEVLNRASQMLKERYSIHQTTLQVEEYQEAMDGCRTCQNVSSGKRFSLCWS